MSHTGCTFICTVAAVVVAGQ